jgi:hypothetical protein
MQAAPQRRGRRQILLIGDPSGHRLSQTVGDFHQRFGFIRAVGQRLRKIRESYLNPTFSVRAQYRRPRKSGLYAARHFFPH